MSTAILEIVLASLALAAATGALVSQIAAVRRDIRKRRESQSKVQP